LDEKYPEKFFNTTIVGQALQFDQICLKENQQTLISIVEEKSKNKYRLLFRLSGRATQPQFFV